MTLNASRLHAEGDCGDWCPVCADDDARDTSERAAEAAEARAEAEGRPKCRWCGQRRHMNVAPDWCGVCDEPATS